MGEQKGGTTLTSMFLNLTDASESVDGFSLRSGTFWGRSLSVAEDAACSERHIWFANSALDTVEVGELVGGAEVVDMAESKDSEGCAVQVTRPVSCRIHG